MIIKLKKSKIKNFKGIKELEVNFGYKTDIFGENGTGKTSIYDAYLWCLFGKDSQDKKDFEIQPLDSNNNIIHGLETRVDLTLEVDGVESVYSRVYKEKWTKQRGQAEKTLTGHTTEYYIDEVPQKQKDFNSKINDIMDSEIFKLVSNPLYFASLDWKKQREILFEIIGDIDDDTVLNYKESLHKLKELLGKNTVDDFNKKVKAQISKLKKDRESIPARIDECNNSKKDLDWAALEIEKRTLIGKVKELDSQIADSSKKNEGKIKLQEQLMKFQNEYNSKLAAARSKTQDELFKAKEEYNSKLLEARTNAYKPRLELQKQINSLNNKFNDISNKYNIKKNEVSRIDSDLNKISNDISSLEEDRKKLLKEYHKVDDSIFEFDSTLSHCPTCGREYDNVEDIKANAEDKFNKDKNINLESITKRGKNIAGLIEESKEGFKQLESKKYEADKELEELKKKEQSINEEIIQLKTKEASIKPNDITFDCKEELENKIKLLSESNITFEGQEELKASIESIQTQISAFKDADNSLLVKEKESLQSQIEDITKQLALQDNNKELYNRIKKLSEEEKNIGIKIAELEGQQFLCEEFTRTKVELLEGKINSKFKTLRFKLFNNLNNGGLEETCEILVSGVPYSNVNTAGRINAGVEIINTLSEHYGIRCPLWIDNRESVNNLVETNSQLVNLVVSKDKKLNVEGE